ncbi:TPA: hypothetical protein OME36_003993 [Klebsiella michiganensis]|nr:hypothetical protein [Klebsiella michiganensis]HDX8856201.1 hypothetical protein [Klebsiella michiganensis]
MPVNTLIKTITIPNSIAGEHKFEIYQEENGNFYADIYGKNNDGFWVMIKDYYFFTRADIIQDAVDSCVKYVTNREIDLKAIKNR